MTPIAIRPRPSAAKAGGARNCQTETPAARATTSSSLRVRLMKAAIAPNRTTKGRICSVTIGVSRRASQAIKAALALGLSLERRSSSTKVTM